MQAWQLQMVPGSYVKGEVPTPTPQTEEVVVKVTAFGLNHLDLWLSEGKPRPTTLPHVTGADGVGVVHEVGAGVAGFQPGDEVVVNPLITCGVCAQCSAGRESLCDQLSILGEVRWGTFGEYVVLPSRNVAIKPSAVPLEVASSFALTTMTALHMIRRSRIELGERALVTGIGGGVAQSLFEILKSRGIETTISSRHAEKLNTMKERGASDVFVATEDLPAKSFDVVFDSVGRAMWPSTVNSLRKGGRFVTCGGTGGVHVDLSLAQMFWNQLEMIGVTMGDFSDFNEALRLVNGGLIIPIDEVVPYDELPRALAILSSGRQLGKVVISRLG